MTDEALLGEAKNYLDGGELTLGRADVLWMKLTKGDEPSLAAQVQTRLLQALTAAATGYLGGGKLSAKEADTVCSLLRTHGELPLADSVRTRLLTDLTGVATGYVGGGKLLAKEADTVCSLLRTHGELPLADNLQASLLKDLAAAADSYLEDPRLGFAEADALWMLLVKYGELSRAHKVLAALIGTLVEAANAFLAGDELTFGKADTLWSKLKKHDELSLARRVLERMLHGKGTISEGVPPDRRKELIVQEAMLTSKDPELPMSTRHCLALDVLRDASIDIFAPSMDGDAETLGIAGGIYKRLWNDLGRLEDLIQASKLYERGATGGLGDDAYTQINAAFIEDILAAAGDQPDRRRARATAMRRRIVDRLPALPSWWNAASRAEALFGLGEYGEATKEIQRVQDKPAPWELQTTARQLAHLAHLKVPRPLENAGIRAFFAALLPGAEDVVRSVIVGKIGLALSGGGFRASFFHLGVLAYLAERDVLRHVEVLSCVSGGSIVGACYWLALRSRLLKGGQVDYVALVEELIRTFEQAVAANLRGAAQEPWYKLLGRVASGNKGILNPELSADALEKLFYQPLFAGANPIYMHDLAFQPHDHDPLVTGSPEFNPTKHNWLRAHKVPALIINATTVNTGHAWQFTPTWMGESPWAIHEAADSVPRLEWARYEPNEGWQIRLGRAVAASACVPGVFAPLLLGGGYKDQNVQVSLVDGGVHDNQGTVSLLASNCSVLLVSDACGQLMMENESKPGLWQTVTYAARFMSILMERIRWANFADLDARRRSGVLRGLMFLHMKAGLEADVVRLSFSQDAYELQRSTLAPTGVRRDFQQALAELRTDLDDFSTDESAALMACGYQMASRRFPKDLAALDGLSEAPAAVKWPFDAMRAEITSARPSTQRRAALLAAFGKGASMTFLQ